MTWPHLLETAGGLGAYLLRFQDLGFGVIYRAFGCIGFHLVVARMLCLLGLAGALR